MRVFLVAGEPSGDRLGAALMEGLRTLSPGVEFAGVGGARMTAAGLESLFPMEELSVMGLVEVLPKYRHLMRRIEQTAEAALRFDPAVVVTVDSPDFSLRVAGRIKAVRPDLPVVHYVAPSVWAWRPGRAQKMARVVDHVLALLPFEPPYMEAAGMGCDFVGHPIASEPQADEADARAFRESLGGGPVLLVLPGSRRGEVSRLAPVFGEVAGRLLAEYPGLRLVVPTVRGVARQVEEAVAAWPLAPLLLSEGDPRRPAAFRAADAALAASGTVSLELAAADVPMVIAYRFNWLTWQVMRRMLRVDTATLVNLVSDTRAVPEFIGENCRAERIAPVLSRLLAGDAGDQHAAMRLAMERLGRGADPAGLRAARSVLAVAGRRALAGPRGR